MASDDDSFLARWSRRKHAVRRGETPPEPVRSEAQAADPPPPAPPVADAPPELPPVESLKGLESDYKDFLRPEVDPATRSAALKKLFGDPHFNQMDGLDTYIDDYYEGGSDPGDDAARAEPGAFARAVRRRREGEGARGTAGGRDLAGGRRR